MLINALFGIASILLNFVLYPILNGLSSAITFIIPPQIGTSISSLLALLAPAQGWFPIITLLQCIAFLFLYYLLSVFIRMFLWVWHFFTGLLHGHTGDGLAHTSSNNLKKHNLGRRHVVDNRRHIDYYK